MQQLISEGVTVWRVIVCIVLEYYQMLLYISYTI
jgi:hypothetical protein